MPFFRRVFGPGGGRGAGRMWNTAFILLLLAERPSHGYELAERLAEFNLGRSGVGHIGGLYRILTELEANGLIRGEWDTSNPGPARKTYSSTKKGLSFLDTIAEDFNDLDKIVDRFLKRYEEIVEKT